MAKPKSKAAVATDALAAYRRRDKELAEERKASDKLNKLKTRLADETTALRVASVAGAVVGQVVAISVGELNRINPAGMAATAGHAIGLAGLLLAAFSDGPIGLGAGQALYIASPVQTGITTYERGVSRWSKEVTVTTTRP